MTSDLAINTKEYKAWLTEIKLRIRTVQMKAAVSVNSELLRFYWALGSDIVAKQTTTQWGDGFLSQVSRDLTREFTEMKGYSPRGTSNSCVSGICSTVEQSCRINLRNRLFRKHQTRNLGNRLLPKLRPSPGDIISQSSRNARMSKKPSTT